MTAALSLRSRRADTNPGTGGPDLILEATGREIPAGCRGQVPRSEVPTTVVAESEPYLEGQA